MSRLIAICVLMASVGIVEAGPFRRNHHYTQTYQPVQVQQPTYFISSVQQPEMVSESGNEALGEVNAKRAARGLRPFIFDPNLTVAAQRAATYRAQHQLFGHLIGGMGDFGFLPPGTSAASAGCAAYPASYGWLSCCTYESKCTYAGAAWAMGSDGKRYMHLFVR